MGQHAAVTIVSKNYLAYARTLAQSYTRHHPDHDFVIVLVDRADDYSTGPLPPRTEIVEIANIAIPDISRFIYRYTVIELNTAVKPFVLADLFRRRKYETLVYLDPDIYVFRPLTHVQESLRSASIVLIPHIRRPYYDAAMPSDLAILQSGTYNLGFIALRAGETARKLLAWWMSKLHKDCVIDIPNGLFTDQKWIDLVPGFFPDHAILYEPGYDVAYWNLHERPISRRDGDWLAGGEPLYFFHFSGYSPFAPLQLSKHQNRHSLAAMPILKALTDFYARALLDNGYDESSAWPYAFETLANGVRIPLPLVTAVMQWAIRNQVPTPCPVKEPDAFCRFLMSRGVLPGGLGLVLLFYFLLRARGDVAAAFPNSVRDHDDRGFRDWIVGSGVHEHKLQGLLAFDDKNAVHDAVGDLFKRMRASSLEHVEKKCRTIWTDSKSFDDLTSWLATQGARVLGVPRTYATRLSQAVPGVGKILNIYFLRGDLQAQFPALWSDAQISEFGGWLRENRYIIDATLDEISLFSEFARGAKVLIETMRFLYLHKGGKTKSSPNIYAVDRRRYEIGCTLSTAQMLEFFSDTTIADPLDHYLDAFPVDGARVADEYGRFTVDGLDQRKNFLFIRELEQRMEARRQTACTVNFAGYLTAPTGMGESARSMRRTLEHCTASVREMTLPHVRAEFTTLPASPYLFGWPASGAQVSVTVANADAASLLREFLPRSYWAGKNVGYWVWETEELPLHLSKGAELFDEIWAPSAYSAQAIARTLTLPVRVVPHTLDFAALDAARANRRALGLPERGTLFGFMFDPESGVERKNVEGLIRAFCAAFRKEDGCYLVIKVNGRTEGLFDYEMVRARTNSDRVLFYEAPLTRSRSYDFLASLDVYASLHRAEGFGLTGAEAMALGVPVVASGYSGNVDFMQEDSSVLVPVKVVETDRAYGPYPPGTRWGEPDAEAAVMALRSLLDAEKRTNIGARARESIRATLSPTAVAATAGELLAALSASRRQRLPPPSADTSAEAGAGAG